MKGRNAAKAFQESRGARYPKSRDDIAERRAERGAPEYLVVDEAEVRDTDEILHRDGDKVFVARERNQA